MPRFLVLALALALLVAPCADAGDAAWYDQAPLLTKFDPAYEPAQRSLYIYMRDGTRLAATAHLPKELAPGTTKIPTILHQTRYWRNGPESQWCAKFFVPHGYAFVSVDVRGSGASFGTRRYELSPEELEDGRDLLDWIVAQPWSNGKVATLGASYTGATAGRAVALGHPALVAAIPGQIAFDFHENILFPGGVYSQWLMSTWQDLVTKLDGNDPVLKASFGGAAPVDGPEGGKLRDEAVAGHAKNFRIHDMLSSVDFRDDVRKDALGGEMTADDMGMHFLAERMEASKAVAQLNVSGWFDGALQVGAIQRFLRFPSKESRLVIGPWDHRNSYVSPWKTDDGAGRRVFFDADFHLWAHYLRFLDHRMKGLDTTGAANDPPVAYFTMGEEKWKFAETWPPPGTRTVARYFAENGTLAESASPNAGTDRYTVDFTTNTGRDNRVVSVVNLTGQPIGYFDRESQQEKLLTYTTPPLEADLEVTGHARVTLFVASTATDGAFHVYLEEVVAPDDVRYVTEGILRASHRKTAPAPYPTPALYRSHLAKDAAPLVPGETVELAIDLLPTSYRFQKGHRLRVGLAGADSTMYERIPAEGPPPVWTVARGGDRVSRIDLPVMTPARPVSNPERGSE